MEGEWKDMDYSDIDYQPYNHLEPSQFQLVLSRSKLKNLSYSVQSVAMPSVSVTAVDIPYGKITIHETGDTLEYQPLDLTFLADEFMLNVQELLDWMNEQVNVDKRNTDTHYRDIILQIFSKSANKLIREIKFYSAWPTSIDSLGFDSSVTDIQYFIISASFMYDYYELLPIPEHRQ